MEKARDVLLEHFRWVSGHADFWPAVHSGADLTAIVDGLCASWGSAGITHVAGVESRGFVFGAAVALRLGAGFLPVRKVGSGLIYGTREMLRSEPDYRGNTHEFWIQKALGSGDRVLLVDDWAETGSAALTARALLERGGATYVGLCLLVDELEGPVRSALAPVTALVHSRELG